MKLYDPELDLAAVTVDDLEKARIAATNRLKALTKHDVEDDDAEVRFSLGLADDAPSVVSTAAIVKALGDVEKIAVKHLETRMKDHPLGPWVLRQKGIGLKQGARLLAAVRDPYWHEPQDRPRLVSELWSYCGYGVEDGAAPKHKAKVQGHWSDEARMRARLVAESCIKVKGGGHYRDVYDKAKVKYADAVHRVPCAQCTPKGKPPAEVGTELRDGHKHARALRIVSKEILKDLWIESKRLYEEEK